MTVPVEVWLRENDVAATRAIHGITREPKAWTDEDVRLVLEGMLRAMRGLKDPDGEEARPVSLRGLSWIVNPFEDGGVVLAIEIRLGAAVAGPFDIAQPALEAMVARVLLQGAPPSSATVH
jgi:hypothetical protein